METKKRCIKEIKELYVETQVWFAVLKRTCEHNVGALCQIPVATHPRTGVIRCRLEECPLIHHDIEI